ncbi:MAG: hypothetical protein KA388_05120 [Rhodocyclaceae bacterium]|nr:hypothetical protein [Rhodocyclaceae bacterium]MBP6109441.1 hypothetical protein [Rhodocyclaceae bacterium]MBP6279124.1 hypothetical protein [Rhodocyclaceae bacterium]
MARKELLDRAYGAIGLLRAKGLGTSVERVAEAAALARSTFYLPDPDWQEVRRVIKGKASQRVQLVAIEVTAATRNRGKLREMESRITQAEKEVGDLRRNADQIYRKLINQLQYYVAEAADGPAKLANRAKQLKEAGHAQQELKQLRAQNALLSEQLRLTKNTPTPLTSKRYISLLITATEGEFFTALVDSLEHEIPSESVGKAIGAVYLITGLPLSGKTTWATQHQPIQPGSTLYIEGIFHTIERRSVALGRIRKLTSADVHCVRLRTSAQTCIARSGRTKRGAQQVASQLEIERINQVFEEVGLSEQFASIIPVGLHE